MGTVRSITTEQKVALLQTHLRNAEKRAEKAERELDEARALLDDAIGETFYDVSDPLRKRFEAYHTTWLAAHPAAGEGGG